MNKLVTYLIILIIGIDTVLMHAQVSPTRKLAAGRDYNQYIYSLLDSANYLLNTDPVKAYDFVEQAIELSITHENRRGEAYAYYTLGKINFQLNQYDFSVENFLKAINIFSLINEQDGKYETYKLLGKAYELEGQYDYSMDAYFSFLEKANARGKKEDMIAAKNNIANLYYIQGKYELSKKTYQEVLELEKGRDNKRGIISAQDNIGKIYLEQEKTDKALGYYQSSQSIAEEMADDEVQSNSLDNLGKAFRKSKNLKKELEVRKQSLELNKSRADIPAQAKDNIEIGNIYIEQDKEQEAIPYLQRSISLSENSGNLEQKKEALHSLSRVYDRAGDYNKALKVYKDYVTVTDSIHIRKEKEIFASLEMMTSLNKKQQRIDLLEKNKVLNDKTIELLKREQFLKDQEISSKSRTIYTLVAGILMLFIASFFVYRSSRQKRIANQLLALKSLRSQMNPHFIFNALNSVNSFIVKSDERAANKYLSEFARLMRLVMENSQHDFIPLTEEVTILDLYLRLEHSRFEEKFDYSLEVNQSIDVNAFFIPPMLIQPYIENAIWHGLRYKEEKGVLNVKLKQQNGCLIITVEDNGIGRVRSEEIKTKNQREKISIGLKNIENRLNIINEVHKTKIRVFIEDLNQDGKTGTKVTISIPELSMNHEQT